MKLEGVFVATVTFFLENGSLDRPSFERHCDWLIESGVDGLVPCGTTGEGPTLSSEERKALIEIAVHSASKKNKKVIAGCGGNNTQNVLRMLIEAKEAGAESALVVTPYYNKPTQEGLLAHYNFLADQNILPIVLYNVPSRTGVNLLPETVDELWKHPNIIGLKEATGNHSQWLALSKQLPESKSLLAGDDDAFATLSAMGASGIISASANIIPEKFIALFKLVRSKQWEEAFRLQKQLVPLIQSVFAETNPGPLKFALAVMKKGQNQLRLPLVPVGNNTEKLIEKQLTTLELLK